MRSGVIWEQKPFLSPVKAVIVLAPLVIIFFLGILLYHDSYYSLVIYLSAMFYFVFLFLIKKTNWGIYQDGIQVSMIIGSIFLGRRDRFDWKEIISIGPFYKPTGTGFAHLHGIRIKDKIGEIYRIDFTTDARVRTIRDSAAILDKILSASEHIRKKFTNIPFLSGNEKETLIEVRDQSVYEIQINGIKPGFVLLWVSGSLCATFGIAVILFPGIPWLLIHAALVFTIVLAVLAIVVFILGFIKGSKGNDVKALDIHFMWAKKNKSDEPQCIISVIRDDIPTEKVKESLGTVHFTMTSMLYVILSINLLMCFISMLLVIGLGPVGAGPVLLMFWMGGSSLFYFFWWARRYYVAATTLMDCIRHERTTKKRILPDSFKPDETWNVYRKKPNLTAAEWEKEKKKFKEALSSAYFQMDANIYTRRLQSIHEWELDTGDKIIPDDLNYSPFLQKM